MATSPTDEEIKLNPLIQVMNPLLIDGLLYGTVTKWCVEFKKICTCGKKTDIIEHYDVSWCYEMKKDILDEQEKCSCGTAYSDLELVREVKKPFTYDRFEW